MHYRKRSVEGLFRVFRNMWRKETGRIHEELYKYMVDRKVWRVRNLYIKHPQLLHQETPTLSKLKNVAPAGAFA